MGLWEMEIVDLFDYLHELLVDACETQEAEFKRFLIKEASSPIRFFLDGAATWASADNVQAAFRMRKVFMGVTADIEDAWELLMRAADTNPSFTKNGEIVSPCRALDVLALSSLDSQAALVHLTQLVTDVLERLFEPRPLHHQKPRRHSLAEEKAEQEQQREQQRRRPLSAGWSRHA